MKFLPNTGNFVFRSLGLALVFIFGGLGVLGSGGDEESPPAPLPDQYPTGIWDGTYTNLNAGLFPIKAIIYNDRWILFSDTYLSNPADGILWDGNMTVFSNQFTGNLKNYQFESYSYTLSYTGEVSSKDHIWGDADSDPLRFFSLNYLAISDDGASLLTLESNWNFSNLSFNLDISIDQSGVLSGLDSDGCFYNGSVTVPDPHINVYQLTITKSSCDAKNGNYSGLGYVVGGDFIYAFSNESYAMYGKLGKM
jgi:hypothetical protein